MQYKKGGVYFGSQFRGTVHHCREVTIAGLGGTGLIASAVRKQKLVNACVPLLSPFCLIQDPKFIYNFYRISAPCIQGGPSILSFSKGTLTGISKAFSSR